MDDIQRLAATILLAQELYVNDPTIEEGDANKAADLACEQMGYDLRMTSIIEFLISRSWNPSRDWARENTL